MSDEKKLSDRLRSYLYSMHPIMLSVGELFRYADEIASLEQRLAEAEGEKQQAIKSISGSISNAIEIFRQAQEFPSGLCSAHNTPDPSCRICNPKIGELVNALAEAQARIAELEQELKVVRSMNPDADAIYRAITHDNVIKTASISIEQHSKQIADLTAQLAEAKKDAERYEAKLFALGAMEEPPCFKCGYNGPGYFQTATHPCAHNHHNAMRQEEE